MIASTSTWITLLDCAFLFFWGMPARIVSAEIRCDLPCDEAVFDEEDPFTHPSFAFSRGLTAPTAFRALFKNTETLPLNMLDTFVLIHRKLSAPLQAISADHFRKYCIDSSATLYLFNFGVRMQLEESYHILRYIMT